MATKIILKKSTTGGSVPLAADLDGAEIAINLVDRKIYTKDGSGTIQRLDGAYVDSVAPSNPTEGDLWYDTANNLLKAHNGSSFVSAGYQTLSALEDTTITSAANGEYLKYNGSAWVNSNFETDAEALFSAAHTASTFGNLTYSNGVYTHTGVTQEEIEDVVAGQLVTNGTHTNITVAYDDAGDGAIDLSIADSVIRGKISVTDAGGDGSMSYDSATGVLTYTGPSAAEVQAHITAGTGVSLSSGEISIGQSVGTTDDVTFNNVNVDGQLSVQDSIITIHDANTATPSGDAGIEVYRGGTAENQQLIWNETDDKWEFKDTAGTPNYATVKAAAFEGPLAGAITGDITGDVYAGNGTSKVLENGTDGTDATFTGDVTGQVSDISNHDTDSLSEGTTNLYYQDSRARAAVSVTDAGGDGSLSYNSSTGVITYTGPSAAETRAHFTGGTGVTITNGSIAIGQAVATTDEVEFAEVKTTRVVDTAGTITIDPTDDGLNTGTVVIAGNLTVNGTTTSVNSNEVNIGDSIIVLNADETSAPTQDGGIEIERGTASNVSFVWDETNDQWSLGNETLANVTLDGGTY